MTSFIMSQTTITQAIIHKCNTTKTPKLMLYFLAEEGKYDSTIKFYQEN